MERGRRDEDDGLGQCPDNDGRPIESDRLRVDKWLWYARVTKTRGLASRLVGDGHVRVNGTRIASPARRVGPGDVLTIALERQVRVLRVLETGERRGPFVEARRLYADLSESGDGPVPDKAAIGTG